MSPTTLKQAPRLRASQCRKPSAISARPRNCIWRRFLWSRAAGHCSRPSRLRLVPRLPRVSGADAVRALERLGFVVIRQRGSHIIMRRGASGCSVPNHRETKRSAPSQASSGRQASRPRSSPPNSEPTSPNPFAPADLLHSYVRRQVLCAYRSLPCAFLFQDALRRIVRPNGARTTIWTRRLGRLLSRFGWRQEE